MSRRPGRPSGGPGLSERVRVYRDLRQREGLTQQGIAMRMGVSRRAVQQYARRLRQEMGIKLARGAARPQQEADKAQPRTTRPAQVRPLVLDHLQRWPANQFSSYELARVTSTPDSPNGTCVVQQALNQLVAEGRVDAVVGVRDPGRDLRPVRRYRLRPDCENTRKAMTG